MIKDIKFEDLPQKMQDEWIQYELKNKKDNIKILKICINSYEHSQFITYKIFYEYANILGLAECYDAGYGVRDVNFNILTVYDVKQMYKLSSMIKEFNL